MSHAKKAKISSLCLHPVGMKAYVKLTNTLYYGIHPSKVKPDFVVDHLIDLTEKSEFPLYEGSVRFPIRDRCSASSKTLKQIVEYILSLKGIVYIFCRGGHGRSGMVAAAVYGKLKGLTGDQSLAHINQCWYEQRDLTKLKRKIIKLGSPQTECQKRKVISYLG